MKHIFQEFVVVVVFFELGLLEEMLFLYDLCHGWQRESFVSWNFCCFLAVSGSKERVKRTVFACIGGNRCAVNAVVAIDDLVENG